jgi:plastocyanin
MSRTAPILAFLLVAAGSLVLASCKDASRVSAQEKKQQTVEAKIDNFSFSPPVVTVAVGTTITWTNHDDIPHTVVSADGVFKSKVLDTDDKFSFTFTKAGIFPYYCSIHPKMTAKVVVQ